MKHIYKSRNGIAELEGRGDAEEEGDGSSGEDKNRPVEESVGRADAEAEESSDEHPGRHDTIGPDVYRHCSRQSFLRKHERVQRNWPCIGCWCGCVTAARR